MFSWTRKPYPDGCLPEGCGDELCKWDGCQKGHSMTYRNWQAAKIKHERGLIDDEEFKEMQICVGNYMENHYYAGGVT